jgi:ABC-type multidrug transport system ATPase subunit
MVGKKTLPAHRDDSDLISLQDIGLKRGFFSLSGITLLGQRAQVLLLVGHNGAGKTTLIRTLAGLIQPSIGSISRWHRGIAIATSDALAFGGLTVAQNLSLFSKLEGSPISRESVETWGLAPSLTSKVSNLSRGLTARVSLLRAFSSSAELLLFDEPTSNLDDAGGKLFVDSVQARKGLGHLTIIATHDLTRLLPLASGVIVLERGTIQYQAKTPDEIESALNHYRYSNR